jgi:hypothetical protein
VAAALVLAAACAAILGAAAHAAAQSPIRPFAVMVAATPPAGNRAPLKPLPVVVLTPQADLVPARVVLAPPTTAPSASAPGQVKGIAAPGRGILPPVASLPAPSADHGGSESVLPLAWAAAFVSILLVATMLTARRRL